MLILGILFKAPQLSTFFNLSLPIHREQDSPVKTALRPGWLNKNLGECLRRKRTSMVILILFLKNGTCFLNCGVISTPSASSFPIRTKIIST